MHSCTCAMIVISYRRATGRFQRVDYFPSACLDPPDFVQSMPTPCYNSMRQWVWSPHIRCSTWSGSDNSDHVALTFRGWENCYELTQFRFVSPYGFVLTPISSWWTEVYIGLTTFYLKQSFTTLISSIFLPSPPGQVSVKKITSSINYQECQLQGNLKKQHFSRGAHAYKGKVKTC